MREHSKEAWEIASRYSHVLASETRDLAAAIDAALDGEREACAKMADWIAEHPPAIDVLRPDWHMGCQDGAMAVANAIRKNTMMKLLQ